jgi:hypothetical protein
MKIPGTIIEVKDWIEECYQYTKVIMYSSEEINVKSLVKNYCSLRGLPGTDGLPDNMLKDVTEDFINFLKKEGFSEVKTKSVIFSD